MTNFKEEKIKMILEDKIAILKHIHKNLLTSPNIRKYIESHENNLTEEQKEICWLAWDIANTKEIKSLIKDCDVDYEYPNC